MLSSENMSINGDDDSKARARVKAGDEVDISVEETLQTWDDDSRVRAGQNISAESKLKYLVKELTSNESISVAPSKSNDST